MFEIHTLDLGELMIPDGDSFVRDPMYCWYVTDGTTRLLVDTGLPDASEVKSRLRVDGRGGGHVALQQALSLVGASPEAIDFIILTHLHFDHASNLDLFPKACVILQRDELLHAVDPVPTQRIYFLRETLHNILGRKRPSELRLIDGDVDLVEGIRILKAPGHTPGMQVAVVTTARGRAALVSDLGDHYRYWFPGDARASDRPKRFLADTFLPGPIRSESERDYIASMARVAGASDIVVPAHDFRSPKHIPNEWFAIPGSDGADPGRPRDAATR
jgi:N-acyl homoserine lactone hydrolase